MKRVLIILLVIVIVVGGFLAFVFFRTRQQASAARSNIQTAAVTRATLEAKIGASGSVRSNQSATLNWQTSGTVDEVKVAVGDQVATGDELALLSKSSLSQNLILAQADLVNAKKALDDLLNSPLQQAQAQQAIEDAQNALDDLKNPQLSQAQAQQAVANAQKAVEDANRQFQNTRLPGNQSSIDEAEAQVVLAKDRLDKAKEKYAPYANRPEDNLTRATLLSQMAQAQQQYDAAVRTLNGLLGTASATDQSVAQSKVETALAQLAQAQRDYDRLKNGPTPAELALAEAKLADAQRNWERIKNGPNPDDVAAAQAKVDAAQAAINQSHVTAPFGGTITQVFSQPGDQVAPGTAAFRLDDSSRLLVDLEISEVDINQIANGQAVVLTFDSIPGKEYQGQVNAVASVGETVQGVVNFTVTVEMTDADAQVKPGMSAAAEIVTSSVENALLIPNRAVRTVSGKQEVYVMRTGIPTSVTITLGKSSDTDSELVEGDIKEGDLIVLNPSSLPQNSQFGPGNQGGGGGPFGGGDQQP